MADETKSASELKKEDWMNSKWRPMMGWMYMAVCSADFMLFPVLWSVIQVIGGGEVKTQWQPITLQGAGLFHIAMGAVLGLAAWGRTQEKLGGANNGGIQAPGTGFQSGAPAFGQPQSGGFGSSGGFNLPAPSGFGGNSGFGAPTGGGFNPAPSWGTTPVATAPAVVAGFGGRPAPMQPEQPQI
jgi:hypothetical protein